MIDGSKFEQKCQSTEIYYSNWVGTCWFITVFAPTIPTDHGDMCYQTQLTYRGQIKTSQRFLQPVITLSDWNFCFKPRW
jgi:hypothetical protein